jgi:hypothetical protein
MGHAAPGRLNRPVIHRRRQPLFGSRRPKANFQRPWPVPDYQVYSIGCGKVGGRARGHLQKSPCPFKTGHPERWPSGLRRTLGKRVCGKPYRGFESHSLRQHALKSRGFLHFGAILPPALPIKHIAQSGWGRDTSGAKLRHARKAQPSRNQSQAEYRKPGRYADGGLYLQVTPIPRDEPF